METMATDEFNSVMRVVGTVAKERDDVDELWGWMVRDHDIESVHDILDELAHFAALNSRQMRWKKGDDTKFVRMPWWTRDSTESLFP